MTFSLYPNLRRISRIRALAGLLLILSAIALNHPASAQAEELWASLKEPNHLVIMRHALAPGTGDPQNFELLKCQTQRNLSQQGVQQARNIGDQFRSEGLKNVQVYSSQWCRCMDTATALDLGDVTPLASLNSFYRQYQRQEKQTEELKNWITQAPLQQPTVLVTHQVNITALSGIYPASGELVFLRRMEDGQIKVLGTIKTE